MIKILVLGGLPGTGKSTVVRDLMKQNPGWKRCKLYELLDAEHNESTNLTILGKYDEGETFPGTDKLSMAVQPKALEYFKKAQDGNYIIEGDRLFTMSFLDTISEYDNVELKIFILEADTKLLCERYKDRGSEQSEQFIRGRDTKLSKIMSSFNLMEFIEEYKNETPEDKSVILNEINKFLEV